MSKINALDTDTSIMNNLPLGYYYYYIPYNNLEYGKFLGVTQNDKTVVLCKRSYWMKKQKK